MAASSPNRPLAQWALLALASLGAAVSPGCTAESIDPTAVDPDLGCFAATGRWSTCQGFLHAPDGTRAVLRGVNVAQSRKLPPYEGGTSAADFGTMVELGLNHIRLIWTWAAVMPERGTLDGDYLDRLRDEVTAAGEAGLYVIVDSHQDLFGEAIRDDQGTVGNGAPVWACPDDIAGTFDKRLDPWFANYTHPAVQGCFDNLLADTELQDQFAMAWGAVADRLAGSAQVIGYDLYNEPYWGTQSVPSWEEAWLVPLYERLAQAIAQHDPEGLLFIEPGANKSILGTSNLTQPAVAAEVVYAPHLYDLGMESGQRWDGSIEFAEDRLVVDAEEAARLGGLPMYLGEWGTPAGQDNDVDFVAAVSGLLDARGISWAIWQWGPGEPGSYALVDGERNPHPHALALVRPYLARIAGDELTTQFDDATGAFTATFTARTVDATTWVVIPAGTAVTVQGGKRIASAPGRVEVQADAIGSAVTIEVVRAR